MNTLCLGLVQEKTRSHVGCALDPPTSYNMPTTADPRRHRLLPYVYLALASLFWAGNQVTGRALREAFGPFALTFWRWLVAAVVLAPFVWPQLRAQAPLLRRHWKLLAVLAVLSAALFQSLIYLGLRTTTAINAVLFNSSIPVFILLAAWILDGERTTLRQLAGLAMSLVGILLIVTRGHPASIAALDFHGGDLWVLAAMPVWALYSVLLRRKPPELKGMPLVFVLAAGGLVVLAPAYAIETIWIPPRMPGPQAIVGVVYIGLFASIAALACWNAGVAALGANIAGFTVHLLPLFGTLLAILFLDEAPQLYHALGFTAILGGVVTATFRSGRV